MIKMSKNVPRLFLPLFTAFFLLSLLPMGAAPIDPNEEVQIAIADADNDRIFVFDRCGNFLFAFGISGSEDGQFSSPYGIFIRKDGQIGVVDKVTDDIGNDRIQVFIYTGISSLRCVVA